MAVFRVAKLPLPGLCSKLPFRLLLIVGRGNSLTKNTVAVVAVVAVVVVVVVAVCNC